MEENLIRITPNKEKAESILKIVDTTNEYDISLIDDLRITRNKIAYDGFFVDKDYIERKMKDIQGIIKKLKGIIKAKG